MNYVWFIMYYILCLLYYGLENIALWLLTMDYGKIPLIPKRNQIEIEVNSWKPPEWIPSDFYNTFWVNQFFHLSESQNKFSFFLGEMNGNLIYPCRVVTKSFYVNY
jgi:hypothetical protein